MTSTNTRTGPGRPGFEGRRIEIKLETELLDQLTAYAAEHGLRRPDALRELLRAGLAAETAPAPARMTIQGLFPEAVDPEAAYELLTEESGCSEHSAEVIDTVADVEVSVMAARGHWVLVVDRDRDRDFRVCSTAEAAREAFAEAIVALTDELWTADHGAAIWCDFAGDLDLFYGLARTGRIPAAAIGGLPDES